MTLCFAEEQTPATSMVLRELDQHNAYVPALWRFEVCNVLWLSLRRGRIDSVGASSFLQLLSELNIETRDISFAGTLHLASTMDITFYDAAYLSLAQELGLPLASLDKRLRAAAQKLNVPILPA